MNYVKTIEYDIAVAGGGVAGVAAAVEAARSGKKVVLIDDIGLAPVRQKEQPVFRHNPNCFRKGMHLT